MTPEQNTTRSPDELLVAQAKSRSDLNSMNTSNEERERLKRLAEVASPGPWRVAPPWSGFSEIRAADDGLVFGLAAGVAGERRGENECDANALFLAAANPAAILSLIADLEAQAARVAELEALAQCSGSLTARWQGRAEAAAARIKALEEGLREAAEAYALEVGPGGPNGFVARARALLHQGEAEHG